MAVRKSYHHGDLRRALLDAATDRIREDGPSSLNLRDLARNVGVSHTAPYRHFSDKDALLAALADEGAKALAEAMGESIRGARSPLRRLARAGVAYIDFAQSNPEHFRVMFGPEASRGASPGANPAFAALLDVVGECQRADALPPGDPVALARTAWSLVHGIAELAVADQLGVSTGRDLERFSERAIGALLSGLAD